MFDVTLSFDNGPEPVVTPCVLDLLGDEGIAASFFVLGHKLAADAKCRDLLARAHAEGHWIGNHTWSHSVPLGEAPEPDAPEAEIGRTQAMIGDHARPDRLFRPFGGGGRLGPHLLSRAAADYLAAGGFTCVLWSCVPRDWEDPDGWPERALAEVRRAPWSLVVLHDLPTGAMDRLGGFISMVRDAGGRFRQDFPPECLPIRSGRIAADLGGYVTERPGAAA